MGKEIARVRGGKFAPGESANPGGRPKTVREVVALAREHTTTAYETLVDVAKNGKNEMARVKAAEALLNRGHGVPSTEAEIELGFGNDGPVSFTFNLGADSTNQYDRRDEIVGEVVDEEDA